MVIPLCLDSLSVICEDDMHPVNVHLALREEMHIALYTKENTTGYLI
jgi:hypothetical protein